MKIAICGGTFDPFHRGHLDPILAVRDAMQWDRVIYVPAYRQPFKTQRDSASGWHRFAMAAIATLDVGGCFVSSIELERGAISYTVDTLEQLRTSYPNDTFEWIIGDDNLEKLHEWKSIDRIFELASFVVLTRGNAELPPALATRAIRFARNETVPASSTEIRRRIHSGEPIDDLVDPRVSRYIHHYGLYEEVNP
ncbi:MAG TPA: nicotinate-nucleotide adenylyltransferase [Thermoanaerobaculia bacterium]|nr:nicotinate-nucleotide adenylyltransferase [Thermoanaerobaculia bacterium]